MKKGIFKAATVVFALLLLFAAVVPLSVLAEEVLKESEPDNKRAHRAIEKALDELYKYQYPGYNKKTK